MPGLANEMRPKTFSDYMGDGIRNTLMHRMADPNNYPHTILLYGTRGCGKTTAARLLAKEYQCQHKVDGHACGECDSCKAIDELLIETSASTDTAETGVTELDIASDSNKAAIEEALDEALQPPMWPLKYKILILDECHMASNAAQNRLLKITEEPPKHLVLIFCTTDPDRMLPTLRDRCQLKIQVKKADRLEMRNRMQKCCIQKGWEVSLEALDIIIRHCDQNPRRCWNDLEDIVTDYDKRVNIANVDKYYGGITDDIYFKYLDAANENNIEYLLKFINTDLNEKGIEYRDFLSGLTKFIMSCVEVRFGIGTENYPSSFIDQVKKFFSIYTFAEIDTLLQILEHANTLASRNSDSPDVLKLIISTTALRIGKIPFLSKGLLKAQEEAASENRKGQSKAAERTREKDQNVTIHQDPINDELLSASFGKNVTELAGDIDDDFVDNITEASAEDTGEEWTDSKLMELMSEFSHK